MLFFDPSHAICNFFDTTHLETLTLLDDRYKIRSIKHTLMGTCIEPSISSIHNFDLELSSEKKLGIHRCDFELTPITWDDIFCYLNNIICIEVESNYCKMWLWYFWFFLNRDHMMSSIEFNHSISFWIWYLISKDDRFSFLFDDTHTLPEKYRETITIEEIITENKAYIFSADKIFTNDKCLSESIWRWLNSILNTDSPLTPIAQQSHKCWLIFRCCDNKHFTNTSKHQYRKRIINHRFIIDWHKLFRDSHGYWIEASSASSCENNSFHR